MLKMFLADIVVIFTIIAPTTFLGMATRGIVAGYLKEVVMKNMNYCPECGKQDLTYSQNGIEYYFICKCGWIAGPFSSYLEAKIYLKEN